MFGLRPKGSWTDSLPIEGCVSFVLGRFVTLGSDPRRVFSQGKADQKWHNPLLSDRRLLYWDIQNGRQVDIFIETVHMCHKLRLIDRLAIHPIYPVSRGLVDAQVTDH